METKVPLVIYHAQCADGFTAAWACHRVHPEWEYMEGVHYAPLPDAKGRCVYLLDFAYKLPQMRELIAQAGKVTILDHHKSAMDELEHLLHCNEAYGEFDMNRSGARLAWDYFHPGKEPPVLVKTVEDRDLWRFKYAETRPLMASIFSYPYDFNVYDKLWEDLQNPIRFQVHLQCGQAIERKHHKDIAELIGVAATRETVHGFNVPSLNCPYFYSSDAGHILAQGELFAVCWWQVKDGWQYSLRSDDNGMDVSEIARAYGGGGHKHAAGFKIKDQADLEKFQGG